MHYVGTQVGGQFYGYLNYGEVRYHLAAQRDTIFD